MNRIATAAVAIPLVVLITFFAPHWIFALAAGLVAALAVEEFLSLGFRVWHVFLAHEMFVNEVVVEKNGFAAGTLSEFSEEPVVALSEKVNNFVRTDRGLFRGSRCLGWAQKVSRRHWAILRGSNFGVEWNLTRRQ